MNYIRIRVADTEEKEIVGFWFRIHQAFSKPDPGPTRIPGLKTFLSRDVTFTYEH